MPLDEYGRLDCTNLVIPEGYTTLGPIWSTTHCLGVSDNPIGSRHTLCFNVHTCDKQEQLGAQLLGIAFRGTYVCRTCICNAQNCLPNRHLCETPAPFDVSTERLRELMEKYGDSVLPCRLSESWFQHFEDEIFTEYAIDPSPEDNWYDSQPVGKRSRIDHDSYYKILDVSKLTLNVKREPGHKLVTKSRGIQFTPSPATQALTGPKVTRLQKATCKVFDGTRVHQGITLTIASGLNSAGLGRWMARARERGCNTWYERDGIKWDSRVWAGLSELKCRHYDRVLGKEFGKLMRDHVVCSGAAYGKYGQFVKYTVDATTKSGHSDTSLGNSVLNGLVAAEAMLRLGLEGDIIVVGDDLLVGVIGDFDEHAVASIESEQGIAPEYRKFHDWRDVTFISGRWLRNGADFVFVPLLGRLLSRLGWTTKHMPARDHDKWRRTVRLGLMPTLGGHPVYRALLDTLGCAEGDMLRVKDLEERSKIFSNTVVWEADAVQHLAELYGLTVAALSGLVDFLRCAPVGVGLLAYDPVAEIIILHDTSEIGVRPVSGTGR